MRAVIDDLLVRLGRIKTHKFKLPLFLKMFFNQNIEISKLLENKTNLILYNRLARNVLRYKNPMQINDADVYKSLIIKYIPHISFVNNYVNFTDFLLKQNSIKNNFNEELSFLDIEQILENENPMEIVLAQLHIKFLEDTILIDNAFYRILSLSAFMNPELYSNKYLNAHFEYMFRYYNTNNLAFTNLQNGAPYLNIKMTDEDLILALSSLKPLENLNLNNIIRQNDEYFVYKCDNIKLNDKKIDNYITINGKRKINPEFFLKIKKLSLSDVYEYPEMMEAIQGDLIAFYKFSTELQNNNQNKNITLANLEKLGNLQQESYTSFLRDIDLQTLRYGI